MELKNIRTRTDFIEWLRESPIEVEECDLEEVADWFIAMTNARLILEEYTLKDFARDLLDGVKGINADPEEAHRNFWMLVAEDDIVGLLEKHFGVDLS